jgi:sulfur transfer complex TusBCD TusB component (DsrH family)
MSIQIDMKAMNTRIQTIKKMATELNQMADDFPAIARNTERILSSTKMIEINLSDLVDLETGP